jgi:hypothetical protein
MKCIIEMASDGMLPMPSFMKIGIGVRKVLGSDT